MDANTRTHACTHTHTHTSTRSQLETTKKEHKTHKNTAITVWIACDVMRCVVSLCVALKSGGHRNDSAIADVNNSLRMESGSTMAMMPLISQECVGQSVLRRIEWCSKKSREERNVDNNNDGDEDDEDDEADRGTRMRWRRSSTMMNKVLFLNDLHIPTTSWKWWWWWWQRRPSEEAITLNACIEGTSRSENEIKRLKNVRSDHTNGMCDLNVNQTIVGLGELAANFDRNAIPKWKRLVGNKPKILVDQWPSKTGPDSSNSFFKSFFLSRQSPATITAAPTCSEDNRSSLTLAPSRCRTSSKWPNDI